MNELPSLLEWLLWVWFGASIYLGVGVVRAIPYMPYFPIGKILEGIVWWLPDFVKGSIYELRYGITKHNAWPYND